MSNEFGWRVLTDFGADPTGNADSSVPLNNAIASIPAGGTILVPAGTFRFTSPIDWTIATNVVLWFAGGASRIGANASFTASGTGNLIVAWSGSSYPLTSSNAAQLLAKIIPNNVSGYCDGSRASFALTVGQTVLTQTYNARDCRVTINGTVQTPYRPQSPLPWLTPIDQSGQFRTVIRPRAGVSRSVLVLNRPPSRGANVDVELPNSTATTVATVARYPLLARFIALGD